MWSLEGVVGITMVSIYAAFRYYVARSSAPKKLTNNDDVPICEFQSPAHPKLAIIFFHDLLWNGEDSQQIHKSTWMSSTETPVSWPQTWLGPKYPDAQILSAWYDAAIRKGKTEGHMDLFRVGENLCSDILKICTADVPVFLVGHGFGGVVINELLEGMWRQTYKNDNNLLKFESFLKNVSGIMYYSTPFFGSKLANSMRHKIKQIEDEKSLNSCWWRKAPSTSSLLDNLAVLNTEVCRLNYSFDDWRKAYPECQTRFLLEGLPTTVGSWQGHLVEEASARYGGNPVYTVPYSDHFGICKPRNNDSDNRFTFLTDLIDSIMNSRPPTPIEDSAKNACARYVEEFSREIQVLGEKGELVVSTNKLREIKKFEDLRGKLQDGLDEAGLQKSYEDRNVEHYMRVKFI
ncbi:unnamed protein product [Calypogeia fissa]